MKKIISLLVVLAMVMALVPAVFADSNVIAPGDGVEIPVTAGTTLTISVSHGDCYINDAPFRVSDDDGDGIISATINDYMNQGFVALVNYGTEPLTWDYADAPGGEGGGNGEGGGLPEQNGEGTYTIAPEDGVEIAANAGDVVTVQVSHASCFVMDGMNRYFDEDNDGIIECTVIDFMGSGCVTIVNIGTEDLVAVVTYGSTSGGQGGSNNPGGSGEPMGTQSNPYIITELPYSIEFFGGMDAYYSYTPTEDGELVVSALEGGLLSFPNGDLWNYDGNGNYVIPVIAGQELVLNPWTMRAEISGVMIVGYTGGGESTPDGTQGNPFVIEELPYAIEFFGGMDQYYSFTPAEDGTIVVTALEGGLLSFPNGDLWEQDANGNYVIPVTAGQELVLNPWTMRAELEGYMYVNYLVEVESAPMSGENVAVSADEAIEIYYTPVADGVLTLEVSGTPGFRVVVSAVLTEETVGLPKETSLPKTLTYDLVAGVEYKILICGYNTTAWDVCDATITYAATFEASEISGAYEDLAESTVELVVGEQNVELLANAITTLYNFTAPEAGVYTVTIPDEAFAELYNVAWMSYQISEGNTLVFTATADEQGFLIGLTSELDFVNIKIEKTGTYTPPAETTYLDYEATVEFDEDFVMPEGEVTSVDITAAQTVVLGTDGYYHLGTANGPILYVNLNSEGFTLATLMSAGAPITMRGEKFEGQDGQLYCYDYMNLIAYGDYFGYSYDNDYYPLNDDLMAFFQDYGAAQGWYNADFSGFDAIKAGGFNEESAWMVALVYIADDANQGGNTGNQGGNTGNQGGNTGNEGGNTGNEGGNTGNNATTGDFGVIAAAVALGMSAICGTAVIAKKKEN